MRDRQKSPKIVSCEELTGCPQTYLAASVRLSSSDVLLIPLPQWDAAWLDGVCSV